MIHETWMSHGYCFNWNLYVTLMWVIGNIGTWICYTIIPVILFRISLIVYHNHPKLRHLFYWSAGFIISCGANHFMHTWTLWHPDYTVEAGMQMITFLVSACALIALRKSLPEVSEHVTFTSRPPEETPNGSEGT